MSLNIAKYAALITIPLLYHNVYALSVTQIYDHIDTLYPKYKNITYTQPTKNYLSKQWLIQTPNIWGKSITIYNKSFTPSSGNVLDKDFYMPTCNVAKDCSGYSICNSPDYTQDINGKSKKLCTAPADDILSQIYETISSANNSVDIVTLQPPDFVESSFSTEAFTSAITNALIILAKKTIKTGKPIQIRLIQGAYLPITAQTRNSSTENNMRVKQLKYSQDTYLKNIVKSLPAGNHLNISVGTMRSCQSGIVPCGNEDIQKDPYLDFAFNHGKIINVDGTTLITGGHNLWGQDYLQKDPVNDLSIKISGPVATWSVKYANTIWDYTCKNRGILSNLVYTYKDANYSSNCLPDIPNNDKKPYKIDSTDIEVSAMSVAKLNNNVLGNDADQSEIARVYAFNSAENNIKVSQQAIFTKGIGGIPRPTLHPLATKDGTVMEALANALAKGVSVYIVTSSLGGSGYSSNVDSKYIWDYLSEVLVNKHGLPFSTVNQLLHKYLHLGFISYDNDNKNMNDKNHNKVWIVDDKVFYIGSHNIYPSSLQQFGVIIDSSQATSLLENQLWDPLWKYAQKYNPVVY